MGAKEAVLLVVCFLFCFCTAQTNITAERGQDVIRPSKDPNINNKTTIVYVGETLALTCQVPDVYKPFTGAECSSTAHGQEPKLLFLFRDERVSHLDQHSSYHNRVDLQEEEIKNGNLCANITNMTMEDAGRYVCRVFQGNMNAVICDLDVKVLPPRNKAEMTGDGGDKDGFNLVGIIVGSGVGVRVLLAVLAFIGFLIYKRPMRQNPNRSVPRDEAERMPMSTLSGSAAEPTQPSASLMDPAAEEQTEPVSPAAMSSR